LAEDSFHEHGVENPGPVLIEVGTSEHHGGGEQQREPADADTERDQQAATRTSLLSPDADRARRPPARSL